MLPTEIERHILIVDVPKGRSPSRGDIENSFHYMDYSTIWHCVSLVHSGTLTDDFSKIVYHDGEWKRGLEYIYGPKDNGEKLEQNAWMIEALREAERVLSVESAKITKLSYDSQQSGAIESKGERTP